MSETYDGWTAEEVLRDLPNWTSLDLDRLAERLHAFGHRRWRAVAEAARIVREREEEA